MSDRKIYKMNNKKGFTLLEVIVSIIVAAILGTMLVAFMRTGVLHSADPVAIAKNGSYLNEIMESMVADYTSIQTTTPGPTGLESFRQRVISTSPYYYGSGYTTTATYISIDNGPNVTATSGSCPGNSNCNLQVKVSYQGLSITGLFGG